MLILAPVKVIKIILLHPQDLTPVQSWIFENKSLIRIGRATDNQVILYSAVVSRHHAEVQQVNGKWQIVNLGANGTYLDNKRIPEAAAIADGDIFRLAQSGPRLQIRFEAVPLQPKENMSSHKS